MARGGDIDLYTETDRVVPNRVQVLCRLEGALVMALGDRNRPRKFLAPCRVEQQLGSLAGAADGGA